MHNAAIWHRIDAERSNLMQKLCRTYVLCMFFLLPRFGLCLLIRGSKAVLQAPLRATGTTSALPLTARRVYSYRRGEALYAMNPGTPLRPRPARATLGRGGGMTFAGSSMACADLRSRLAAFAPDWRLCATSALCTPQGLCANEATLRYERFAHPVGALRQ